MRKFIAIIILCLFPSLAWGISPAIIGGCSRVNHGGSGGVPTYDYCSTCPDADAGADVICEDLEAGDIDGICDWTVSTGDDGEIDLNDSCDNDPALGCTDINMTYCVSVIKPSDNTSTANCYMYKASTAIRQYTQLYIKFTAESLADGTGVTFWAIASADNPSTPAVGIQIYRSGESRYFRMIYYTTGTGTDVGGTAISMDKWYGIRIDAHNSATENQDSIQWWVDYNTEAWGTWTDEGTTSGKTLGYAFGIQRIGIRSAATPMTYYITGIKVDDDAMPGACTR